MYSGMILGIFEKVKYNFDILYDKPNFNSSLWLSCDSSMLLGNKNDLKWDYFYKTSEDTYYIKSDNICCKSPVFKNQSI